MTINAALKDPTTGAITIPAHTFGSGLQLWAEGLINRTAFLAGVKVPAHATADVDAMAAVYTAKATAVEKVAYLLRAQNMAILLQTDVITPVQYRTFMELAP